MGKDTKTSEQDALDRALARLTRTARQPFELPEPDARVSDDMLLRVMEGVASPEEKARVAAAGKGIQERLADLTAGLAEASALPGPVSRAARYVLLRAKDALEVVRSAVSPLPGQAAPAVRGAVAQPARPTLLEFDDTIAELPARLRLEHAGEAVDLQLSVPAGHPARVTLSAQGQVVESMQVSKDGVATFRGLGDQLYELEVRRAGEGGRAGAIQLDIRS
jgi:hypothetical protein